MKEDFEPMREFAPQIPILATKLYVPPNPQNLVSRKRLIERMKMALSKKVTVVTAPAGFGKSTLFSEWIQDLQVHVGWVALDKGENDITQFWTYVIAALQRIKTGVGHQMVTLMQTPFRPSIETMITLLVNDLVTISEEFVLILDDYHTIEDEDVHRSFAYLLDRIPVQMHVCIASRTNIPLSLGKMRMQGLVNEISIADMRFSREEMSSYWHQHVGVLLSQSDLQVLEYRTEGWIAGLQLAALFSKDQRSASHAIHSFTGSNRHVVDYLMEEVFQNLPIDVQTFLLQTSILEQLNASLGVAVTGLKERDYLGWLEKTNLFLIPLDEERYWYRYHHLFADFLKNRLKLESVTSIPNLHQRASEWLEQNHYLEQAIDHAFLSQDIDRAANLIVKHANQFFFRREINLISRWLEKLPKNLRSQYDLLIIHCWTEMLSGNISATQLSLDEIRRKLSTEAHAIPVNVLMRIYSEITILMNFIALIKKDFHGAVQLMTELVEKSGGKPAGERENENILINTGVELNGGDASVSKGFWGFCGRIKQAEIYHDLFYRFIQRNHLQDYHYAANNYSILSEIFYEKNELDKAMKFAELARKVAFKRKNIGAYVPANLTIARIHFARGNFEMAISQIEKAITELFHMGEHQIHWHAVFQAFLAQCYVLSGDSERVDHWLQTSHVNVHREVTIYQEFENLTLLRVMIAKQSYVEALQFSKRLLHAAIMEERTGNILENTLLQAIILFQLDDMEQAVRKLHEALHLAETEGYMRTILDERTILKDLMKKYVDLRKNRYMSELFNGVSIRFVEKLLTAMGEEGVILGRFDSEASEVASLLTNREIEVLHLLSQGLTNKQLAENLSLSVGTIKLHLNHIYSKLNCSNRIQAIQKSKDLQLLD